jgi:hypothetical protein
MNDSGFCTDCGVKIESFESLNTNNCPLCGSTSIPCADNNQVNISINWHELHVLTVWAEQFAKDAEMKTTVWSIAHRIEKQYPEKHLLTLAGEMSQLKREFPNAEINGIAGVE